MRTCLWDPITLFYLLFVNPFFNIKEICYIIYTYIQEKISVKEIGAANDVTHPMLGLPNPTSSQCLTCDAKNVKTCEGAHKKLSCFIRLPSITLLIECTSKNI